jgi:hypothetical protein
LWWFVVRVWDKCGDDFFLFLLLSFKGSFPVFGKWSVKWSKLLWVFFFFNRNFLSGFQWRGGIWCGVFSPKLFKGFLES